MVRDEVYFVGKGIMVEVINGPIPHQVVHVQCLSNAFLLLKETCLHSQ